MTEAAQNETTDKLKSKLCKSQINLVLLTQDDLGRLELGIAIERWPLDSGSRVVPHESAFIIGMVDIIAFVAKLGSIGQNKEAMCEPARNKN